jgi:hypothetical protein
LADIEVRDGAQATTTKRTPPTVNEPIFPTITSPKNFDKSPLSSLGHSSNLATTSNVKLTEVTSPTSSGEKSGADEDIMSISSDSSDDTETYEPEVRIPPEDIHTKLDAEDEDESYQPMADLTAQLTPSETFSPRPEIIPLNDAKSTISRDSGQESSEVTINLAPELQPTGQSIIPLVSARTR